MASDKLKSVDIALKIVRYLMDVDGASVTEIMEEFSISKSSVHRYLSTLESHGYVVREEGTYYLGLGFIEKAQYTRGRKIEYEIAKQIISSLASQTGDRATYVTEENGIGVVMDSEIGEHGIIADIKPGQQVPLHASAVGKAILADWPQSKVKEFLDSNRLQKLTETTITDQEELLSDLEITQDRGYSINRSERIEGIDAVGVPVKGEDGDTIGAFSVSGPARRMTDERISNEISEDLLNAAQEFELRNRYNGTN